MYFYVLLCLGTKPNTIDLSQRVLCSCLHGAIECIVSERDTNDLLS